MNHIRCLADVETAVNLGRDWTDLRSQILLHHPQGVTIIVCDQVHRQSQVTKTPRPANAVKVRLSVLREVEVDDNVHALDVDAPREEVRRHKVTGAPIAELVEDAVAACLLHFGVYVEARVAQLRDFLGEELDAVHRVAENNGLIDLQLGEESVEAVYLLALLDVGVELGNAPEGELLHQVDGIGFGDVLLAEFLDGNGEGGAE